MMKIKNIKTGKVIEVSPEHWQGVLSDQGKYEEYKEEAPVVVQEKKRGRPRKES